MLIGACSFACKPLPGGEYAPRHPDAARLRLHMAYDSAVRQPRSAIFGRHITGAVEPHALEYWRPQPLGVWRVLRRIVRRRVGRIGRRRIVRWRTCGGGGRPGGRRAAPGARGGRPGGPIPDLDQLIAQAQAFIRGLMGRASGGPRGVRPGGPRGLILLAIAVVCLWAASGVLPRATGRARRRAAIRRLQLPHRTRPALAPALADRTRAAAGGHTHQPHRDRLPFGRPADRRNKRRAGRARRAVGKPDADRRREHHRHQPRGVLEDQQRGTIPVQRPRLRTTW